MSDEELKVVILQEMCMYPGSTFADRLILRLKEVETERHSFHTDLLNWAKRLGSRLAWVDFEMYNEWKSFLSKHGVK